MSFFKNFGGTIKAVTTGSTTIIETTEAHGLSVGDTINLTGVGGLAALFRAAGGVIKAVPSSVTIEVEIDSSSVTEPYVPYSFRLVRDEIYRSHNFAVDLVELHLGSGQNLYFCNGGIDLTVDTTTAPDAGSNIYEAQGDFIGFSPLDEDFDVRVGKFSIYLAGVGNNLVDYFIENNVVGKRVVIYKAFLELQTLAIVQSPVLMFDGQIHNVTIKETPSSCQINVDCASLFADFERTAGRKTNNWSNWFFQGAQIDTSMEKTGFVGQTEFKWGKV
jgi:hypothetical protein